MTDHDAYGPTCLICGRVLSEHLATVPENDPDIPEGFFGAGSRTDVRGLYCPRW